MFLFVGLGNPDPKHKNNRHNIGFMIIDSLNKKFNLSKQKPKQMYIINIYKKYYNIVNFGNS